MIEYTESATISTELTPELIFALESTKLGSELLKDYELEDKFIDIDVKFVTKWEEYSEFYSDVSMSRMGYKFIGIAYYIVLDEKEEEINPKGIGELLIILINETLC